MDETDKKSKRWQQGGLVLVFLLLALLAVAVTAPWRQGEDGAAEGPEAAYPAGLAHSLSEAGQAKFLSIFEYDANDGVASFMVGSRTELFASFAAAIEGAQPLAAEAADESFTDLLVLVFGGNDTMELPYSRSRQLLIFEERPYRPAADLVPLINAVQEKLN